MAAKESLNALLDQSGEWARDRWSAFRKESPYFQARIWLILGYLVIVVATLILAPPEGEHWQAKALRLGFGMSFKTAISLTNIDNGDLEGVVVEVRGEGVEFDGKKVPGVWRSKPLNLPEEAEVRILPEQLFDAKGVSPPYALSVATISIIDDDDVLVTIAPRQVGGP
ncbi:MAG: hypothetical protein A2138_25310 [Deltaproteobacteria bacterium RBG_16_71_12]|nr:MAG: hypothetical protein A2138_25310 [Deltaproteobacteria bacterium RBG_16_71_12]